jgi:hypothetical protein
MFATNKEAIIARDHQEVVHQRAWSYTMHEERLMRDILFSSEYVLDYIQREQWIAMFRHCNSEHIMALFESLSVSDRRDCMQTMKIRGRG